MSKIFTLDEAQTLLPVLRSLLMRARETAVHAGGLDQEMQHLSQRIFLSGGLHVDVPAAARRRAERDKAMGETKSTIEEIESIGARVVEDSEGSLELPCQAEGRVILLCWTLGEDEIERWREDEDGSVQRDLGDGSFGRERPN